MTWAFFFSCLKCTRMKFRLVLFKICFGTKSLEVPNQIPKTKTFPSSPSRDIFHFFSVEWWGRGWWGMRVSVCFSALVHGRVSRFFLWFHWPVMSSMYYQSISKFVQYLEDVRDWRINICTIFYCMQWSCFSMWTWTEDKSMLNFCK